MTHKCDAEVGTYNSWHSCKRNCHCKRQRSPLLPETSKPRVRQKRKILYTGNLHQTYGAMTADFTLENHGTVVILRPCTDSARQWFKDNIVAEAWQWLGDSLAIEPRLAPDIAYGIQGDGLTISCV